MDATIVILSAYQLALVPIVIGLNQVLKQIGLPSNLVPVGSIALGVAGSFFIPGIAGLFAIVVGGISVGLMAVGLYSGTASTVSAVKGFNG